MNADLCIALSARMASTRLPGKAMKTVRGQPLIYWLIRRLEQIGHVVLATTREPSDDALATFVEAMGTPVYRGSSDDVVARIDCAWRAAYPAARYILRGLGDCPFMAGELIDRALDVLRLYDGEAFVWALPPHVLPVYGAREFPYSVEAWQRIVVNARGPEREHSDLFFHHHRNHFRVLYHEPPVADYFRPYRLEIDWEQDLHLVREITKALPPTAALLDILHYLDEHHWVAEINREQVEKTGPSRTTQAERRRHYEWMRNKPVVSWDNKIWKAPSTKAKMIFCHSGQCLLGYGEQGILYRPNGDQISGDALIVCPCGSRQRWTGKER